ncbi:gluconokinase [Microbacterium sp. TWP3-1-2b2]|uniref:gluconokinase n=1 Tax=Microbacterium sp. TWP3-1-2b2 TaxID=2804651 RepID=UPI003CF28971
MSAQNAPAAVVVMGVSGSGKTTVGALLAGRIGARFVDADDLHPAQNKAKMHAGVPLTDEDREPWLRLVGEAIRTERALGRSIVVACSALRRSYRDLIRNEAGDVSFMHLAGSRELLGQRLDARMGHFMPAALLDSQLATLEPLGADEQGAVLDVAVTPEQAVDAALAALAAA